MPRGGRTSGTRIGNGAGYGGPAKPNRIAPKTEAGTEKGREIGRRRFADVNANPEEKQFRTMVNKERIEVMREVLFNVAMNSRMDMAKIMAADKLLDRLEGKPIQPVVTQEEGKMTVILHGDDVNL